MYYVTYKYVVLNDRRLGAGYYSLALLIVLYTLVEIFINRGYLEVSFNTKPPEVGWRGVENCNVRISPVILHNETL